MPSFHPYRRSWARKRYTWRTARRNPPRHLPRFSIPPGEGVHRPCGTKLAREVAVKILPEKLSERPEPPARFTEAELVPVYGSHPGWSREAADRVGIDPART